MLNFKNYTLKELKKLVVDMELEPYRANQLAYWLYKNPVDSFMDMTNLPKSLRDEFEKSCQLFSLNISDVLQSLDGTKKVLFETDEGDYVESVLIPDGERLTLCVSTQIGCRMGCRFCLTGHQKFKRNLTPAEIVDQVILAQRIGDSRITNIVVMGMGEPLDNYHNVVKALSLITHPDALGYSYRKVTLSTVGLIPELKDLITKGPKVTLSYSLNAPNPEKRRSIMPIENRHPMMEVLRLLAEKTKHWRKPPTFEYVLLRGFNDSVGDAKELARLLKKLRCKVNLIPFNPWEGCPFERPEEKRVLAFQEVLIEAGFSTFIRKSRGQDILAACGQLRWRYKM